MMHCAQPLMLELVYCIAMPPLSFQTAFRNVVFEVRLISLYQPKFRKGLVSRMASREHNIEADPYGNASVICQST